MEGDPWRHGEQPPMNWQGAMGGQQWAHHSPQAGPGRRGGGGGATLWDANALADNLNDALGISGPPGGAPAWAGGQPGDFQPQQQAKIWSDPHAMGGGQEHAMHHAHMYPQGGMMNGMMDPNAGVPGAEWGMREQQQMWSDPLKPDEGYWKGQQQGGQQQQQQWGGAQGGPPRWPPQMGGPPHHGGRGGPPGGMVVNPMAGGGWPGAPNGMVGGGGHKPPMWDNGGGGGHRMGGGGMGGRGGGGHRGGNYPPRGHGGMDMSVPPPMDMQGMMQRPPPGGGHMWKPDGGMGGPNGMRGGGGHGGYGGPGGQMGGGAPMGNFMGGGKQQMNDQFVGQFEDESMKFSMGGNGGGGQASDDLMWHDPNGELKKWQRDTGVSVWGDPDKAALRPIQHWIVGENEEEDLESALSRCPIPPKRNEPIAPAPGAPGEENVNPAPSTSSLPFNPRLPPIPSGKRTIVVTGWGDLPDNDPNNPNKMDAVGEKWGEAGASDTPWYLPSSQAGTPFGGAGSGGQGGGAGAAAAVGAGAEGGVWGDNVSRMLGGGGGAVNTEHIADQLRVAVEKGYLDMAVLTQQHLPPAVLAQMNSMLAKIPALEAAEQDLEAFLESSRPPGEVDDASPPSWMGEVQKMEYNSLMIKMTTAKIEVADLSKKMQFALADLREQGALPAEAPPPVSESAHDNYQYSFLG
ncbi:hypothetical protein PFISCL1PPCAC_25858 [Pristionchus fissidentatus]|uniref:Uncharacterized protein n=1 Tax=Pristionchus fissidentatus TaxID=1538716 RepID=A0AAV5WQJ0_9BILA|nr:hypothetical protein PFISCL1PPCAC_25858 [Pristionchus fissidentatus]